MGMVLSKKILESLLNKSPPLVENMIDREVQLQPAGIDITLNSVYSFNGLGKLDFSNEERVLPELNKLSFDKDGWIKLDKGVYLVQFNEIIHMPLDLIAIGKPRSSLLRMGATITTAVWDPGYNGRSYTLLIVGNPFGIKLKRNARILQLIFIKILGKIDKGYNGIYQGEGIV